MRDDAAAMKPKKKLAAKNEETEPTAGGTLAAVASSVAGERLRGM
jgi:hypothetical protein